MAGKSSTEAQTMLLLVPKRDDDNENVFLATNHDCNFNGIARGIVSNRSFIIVNIHFVRFRKFTMDCYSEFCSRSGNDVKRAMI